MNSSFLPEDYLARKLARRSNIVCISLFVLALAVISIMFFIKVQQMNVAMSKNQDVNAEVEDKARQIDQIAKLEQQTQEQKQKAAITSTLVDPVKKSNILAELINHMPVRLSLVQLDLETKSGKSPKPARSTLARKQAEAREAKAPPKVVPREVQMELIGLAPTDVEVGDYIRSLDDHPLFEEVKLLTLEEDLIEDELTMRRFKLELQLSAEITMAELEPTRKTRSIESGRQDQGLTITPDGLTAAPIINE